MILQSLASGLWYYVIIFLLLLTVVVFVHELGHYLVARWNGVRIEVFSIGFGRELVGWTDRRGTRWRLSLLPLGGYVKMLGESEPDQVMTAAEQAQSFHHKRVGQRAAIVFAGPLANFVFGILGLAMLFMAYGQPSTLPVIGGVQPGSAAEQAGLRAGDRVLAVAGSQVERFQDIQHMVRLYGQERISLVVERDGRQMPFEIAPRMVEVTDALGNLQRIPQLGIQADTGATEIIAHGPVSALVTAVRETGVMVSTTFTAVGQMIVGKRDADEIGGPLRIAKGAGQAAQLGFASIVFFTVLISINLGLINLFPIPMLDGGHLAFYAVEAVRGRPLGPRAQDMGFRIGLFLVFALMIFATRNDLVDLKVWEFIKGLTS